MRLQFLLLRLIALVGLTVSAVQLADFASGAGAVCPFGGECEQVAASEYGRPLGVPLPALGVAGFALVFALTLLPNRWAAALLRPLAVLAGLAGAALLVIQFAVLHRVCTLCVVVDTSAILLAAVSLARRPEPRPPSRVGLLVWLVVGTVAVVVPVCWAALQIPEPVPGQVRAHWVPGKVTVVEVTDFDCRFCQQAEPVLREVRARPDVHFVRVVSPMDTHDNARPAARAYVAAARQGKGEEMAAALYAADTRTAQRCRELAAGLGLNMAEYDRVVKDEQTDAELHTTTIWVRKLGKGLPIIWVQDRMISGAPTAEQLNDAIRKANPPER